MKRVLVLFAHPAIHKSKVNLHLIKALNSLEHVTVHNLYETYPDFYIDIKQEQELLTRHDIIIWQHPFYWYSAPAIIKEWLDLVLEHGFAYGHNGSALVGKTVLSVISTGGSRETYTKEGFNRYPITQYLLPFAQTAHLCDMTYLPPFVVHSSHLLTTEDIQNLSLSYRELVKALRDDLIPPESYKQLEYLNDYPLHLKT
ncbi:MAG: NAD(P)H-dependent oxidoreductase [Marinilabiliaceae bacterium]|nr:NAD(P)H-dependent oxidoreductase [Marinilabiliaceae bacterium]